MTPPVTPPDPLGGVMAFVRENFLLLVVQSGVLAWLAARLGGGWRRLKRWRDLVEALCEAVSWTLDKARFEYEYMDGFDGGDLYSWLSGPARLLWLEQHDGEGLSPRDQYDGFKVRLRDLRKKLWKARGFPDVSELSEPGRKASHEEREQHAERVRVLREITTTQRWKLQDKAPKPTTTEAPSENH
jgi:hypothetical protein